MSDARPLSVLNVSAYLFTHLPDAAQLRPVLRGRALDAGLRGTVILAEEGINLFLAGDGHAVRGFVDALRADPRFAALRTRETWSATQPFGKMLVKLKAEIIRMDRPAIAPGRGRAPAVDPATLRRWLDQGHDDAGREVVLLDTRNAFEIDEGAFENAVDWGIDRFTQFPDAAARHRDALVGKTVVSYCTGGIRCEKAALVLRDEGIDAWQLDGGILGWFAEAGQAHYRGDCVVFDDRRAVDSDLLPVRDPAGVGAVGPGPGR